MNCKNCGEIVSGKFCSDCGQKTSIGKITLSRLIRDLSESIFQLNSGLLYTLKELFVQPGKSVHNYLNGKRKKHFKPIAYVLFFCTLYFLISKLNGQNTWLNRAISGFSEGAYSSEMKSEFPILITWFAKNYAYATLFLIPIFSFASYISFYRFKTNYLEHIVLNCYITGNQAIFYSIFSLLHSTFNNESLESFSVIVAMAYSFWVFSRFFTGGNKIITTLRSMLTYALYFIFALVALMILMAIQDFVL